MSTSFRVNGNKKVNHETIKGKVGVTDKHNHNVFYLEGSTFLLPNENIEDFNDALNKVETRCKKMVKELLLNHSALTSDFLMNFEVCSDRMKKGKNTYLSFQYHMKQKGGANKSIINLKEENENLFETILERMNVILNEYGIMTSKQKS